MLLVSASSFNPSACSIASEILLPSSSSYTPSFFTAPVIYIIIFSIFSSFFYFDYKFFKQNILFDLFATFTQNKSIFTDTGFPPADPSPLLPPSQHN